ncbi:MAG: AAA family ATPase [Chloroflexi bacterium]|nr:AAA family ATPase [Chloroflexota bacterium]
MNTKAYEVPIDKLRWQCDASFFDFECTKDLAPLREFIGQERAVRALEFGLSMNQDGYNIYVAGLTGTGKTSMVKAYLKKLLDEKLAKGVQYRVEDWCYLYDFTEADKPQMLNLPRGRGNVLRDQIGNLLQRLREELAKAFSSEEYKAQRGKTIEESQAQQRRLFATVEEEARRQGFMLQMTPLGPVLIPIVEDKPLSHAEYMQLEESVRRDLDSRRDELLKKLQAVFEKAHELESQTMERLQASDKAIADYTVSRLFKNLLDEYKGFPKVMQYLDNLKNYTLNNLDIFKEAPEAERSILGVPASSLRGRDPFLPYQVNVFVDNSATLGPPVIIEPNPNYSNLFGKIERRFLFGGYLSDHTMLKPGALHLADGGYLLLSARDVLTNPAVWPALKRAIRNKEARIEDPFEQFGLIAPQGLKPQPMPIEVKVILIGDGMLYQMLSMYDEDFWELFRVKADVNFELKRTPETMKDFAAFVAGCCEDCKLHHFDKTGVAKVMEYASRMVGDQDKLSSRFAVIKELVEEAEYWACRDGAELVTNNHVEKAIAERRFRHDLPDERITEMIERGIIMIDTEGAVVGQVNGLSVYSLGDIAFGKPSRITCQTFLGRGGVINIERESQLSGRIHDKGVLILSGYMGSKYAQDSPLSLSASLCFEQSYEGVEGDSASSSELYALISSLAEASLKQNIAVTGSVNQKGEIQPIGGVNEKIEGFFRVCKAKGLTGDQGVMIPHQNIKHLMLHEEVIDAIKEGKFHVYAVDTIDHGLEVLTGMEAGQKGTDGTYPEGTINYLVDRKLKEMAAKLRRFTTPETEEKEKPIAKVGRGLKRRSKK